MSGFYFGGVIRGRYASMKNSRKIIRVGNYPRLIKSGDALQWEQMAMQQIPRQPNAYPGLVALVATFYYANPRSDLDENLLKDVIQVGAPGKPRLGIIVNDNQIKIHHTLWRLDKENPRVMFEIFDQDSFLKLPVTYFGEAGNAAK